MERESDFIINEELMLFIGSWNIGGAEMKEDTLLLDWLSPIKEMKSPDIYIINLQEIVNLNAKNIVLSSNTNTVSQWATIFEHNLAKIDK